ncbi:MAG: PA14 domain-containing protein, partial [Planctomycetota bacterium]
MSKNTSNSRRSPGKHACLVRNALKQQLWRDSKTSPAPRLCHLERLEDRRLLTAGNGLLGQYYDTETFSAPALERVDASIDFDWQAGSPDASIQSDTFSIRWTGQIEARFTEEHTFTLNAEDGVRLRIGGQILIDQLDSGSVVEQSASIALIAGRKYPIQLEFREVIGDASVSLEWETASQVREAVPQSQLYAAERGQLLVETWNGISGGNIADLTSNSSYPDSPSSAAFITSTELTTNAG